MMFGTYKQNIISFEQLYKRWMLVIKTHIIVTCIAKVLLLSVSCTRQSNVVLNNALLSKTCSLQTHCLKAFQHIGRLFLFYSLLINN